jgi:hypothetical protein
MERKVGEIFEYNGEWYKCIEQPKDYIGDVCKICSFSGIGNCELDRCVETYRSDGKSVIFKKLEKVGEPFVYDGRIMQKYKDVYSPTIFTYKSLYCYNGLDGRICIEIPKNKENMEEKKLNLKEFNIEAAKAGKPVCTRDGRKVRIICFDAECNKPIVALIYDCNKETVFQYLKSGRFFVDQIDKYDLMMLPQKKEGWVNIYKDFEDTVCCIYSTEKEALEEKETEEDYITTVKIEWEE